MADLFPIGTGITRGVLDRRATGAATDQIVGGLDAATGTQAESLARQTALYQPYRDYGLQGLTRMSDLALNPATFQAPAVSGSALYDKPFVAPTAEQVRATPGYDFMFDEGVKARERSASARGTLLGGAQQKALARYGADYADTKYGEAFERALTEYGLDRDLFEGNERLKYGQSVDAYNREHNLFNEEQDRAYGRASDLTSVGQQGTAGLSGAEKTYAEQVSELEQQKAIALAVGDFLKAATLDEMIAGLSETGQDLLDQSGLTMSDLGRLFGIDGGPGAGDYTRLPLPGMDGGPGAGDYSRIPLPGTGVIDEAAGLGGAAGTAGTVGAGGGATTGGGFSMASLLPLAPLAAAAIPAYFAIKNAQVHPTADEWVQGAQNPFDDLMEQTQDPAQKMELAQGYLAKLQDFAQKGTKEAIVAGQALETFRERYGEPADYGMDVNLPEPESPILAAFGQPTPAPVSMSQLAPTNTNRILQAMRGGG